MSFFSHFIDWDIKICISLALYSYFDTQKSVKEFLQFFLH